jgi:hypothetical protein
VKPRACASRDRAQCAGCQSCRRPEHVHRRRSAAATVPGDAAWKGNDPSDYSTAGGPSATWICIVIPPCEESELRIDGHVLIAAHASGCSRTPPRRCRDRNGNPAARGAPASRQRQPSGQATRDVSRGPDAVARAPTWGAVKAAQQPRAEPGRRGRRSPAWGCRCALARGAAPGCRAAAPRSPALRATTRPLVALLRRVADRSASGDARSVPRGPYEDPRCPA